MRAHGEFKWEPYDKRIADIMARLEANRAAQAALPRGRSGIVPVSQWDEYNRLCRESKAIYKDLSALLDEMQLSPERRPPNTGGAADS